MDTIEHLLCCGLWTALLLFCCWQEKIFHLSENWKQKYTKSISIVLSTIEVLHTRRDERALEHYVEVIELMQSASIKPHEIGFKSTEEIFKVALTAMKGSIADCDGCMKQYFNEIDEWMLYEEYAELTLKRLVAMAPNYAKIIRRYDNLKNKLDKLRALQPRDELVPI